MSLPTHECYREGPVEPALNQILRRRLEEGAERIAAAARLVLLVDDRYLQTRSPGAPYIGRKGRS
eukprot:7229156-Prymnesium_polylepis.1